MDGDVKLRAPTFSTGTSRLPKLAMTGEVLRMGHFLGSTRWRRFFSAPDSARLESVETDLDGERVDHSG
jgi:hypothetical protein